MKVLFDHNVPVRLRSLLQNCDVSTAFEQGWSELKNGDLISAAQAAEFEVLITADQNIFYQQNNQRRVISLVVLSTNRRKLLQLNIDAIQEAVVQCRPGSYEFVLIKP